MHFWQNVWENGGDWLSAVGTIAAVIVALFQDAIRFKFFSPSLRLEPARNLDGAYIQPYSGDFRKAVAPRLYFHLRVVNTKPASPCINCRVILREFSRRGPNGTFQRVPLTLPPAFVWSIFGTLNQTVVAEGFIDFGSFCADRSIFEPTLTAQTVDTFALLKVGETGRYTLEVAGDNFISRKTQTFEVEVLRQWPENDDESEAKKCIRIREISTTERPIPDTNAVPNSPAIVPTSPALGGSARDHRKPTERAQKGH